MIRLFVSLPLTKGVEILPDEKQTHYLLHVMRLKENDPILVFNGTDGEWQAILRLKNKKTVLLCPKKQTRPQNVLPSCILCPALIKRENMELVFQKATELGVTEIFPVITQRTIVRHLNRERAQAIVIEACEQSERLSCPVVHDPVPLFDLPDCLPAETHILFLSERDLPSNFISFLGVPAFLIGPEGGFTAEETQWLKNQTRVLPLHLGDTILRAETASIAVLACWQYRLFK